MLRTSMQRYSALSTAIVSLFAINLTAAKARLVDSRTFRDAITVSGIRAHQNALENIARLHAGNRMASTQGYAASVSYVRNRLEDAGYTVRLQDFPISLSEDHSVPELLVTNPNERTFLADVDFASMITVGNAQLNAEIEAVDLKIPSPSPNYSTSGCEKRDFDTFKHGNIALLQRGSCAFSVKINNAIAAGASGVIIFNEGNSGRTAMLSSRVSTPQADFPVLGASFLVGNILRGSSVHGPTGIHVSMKVDVTVDTRSVQNVIAETDAGDANRVVVVGAHLDSVREGPGMNDNGSGSSTILEIALKYAELGLTPHNKLRFIWFSAEEFGLLGSEFYVNSLTDEEKPRILAMLNFDMVGSPNYARFVYDGDNSAKTEALAASGPQGSGYLENIFLDYFTSNGQATHPTAFNGRSDYGPFIEVGIPAGGLFSGAEGLKSARLAAIYGGVAGAPFDPCYHQACDNFANTGGTESSALALKSLDELSDGAAHAVLHMSNTLDSIRQKNENSAGKKIEFEYRGGLLQK